MKQKIISALIACSMLFGALTVSAFAAPVNVPDAAYSEVLLSNDYNSGSLTDGPDGTSYNKITAETRIMSVGSASRSEMLISFDFRLDDAAADMTFSNSRNKVGPKFSLSGNTFRTQTGGSSYQTVATGVELGKWYSMELEGKYTVADAYVILRLYKWENGERTLISTVNGLNLRNFYAGSNNGDFEFIKASNVSIDNEYAAKLYANSVELSSLADEINGGSTVQLSAAAFRDGKSVTAPGFTWSLYNEDATAPLTDPEITISSAGLLSASNKTASQTVTVRAAADTRGNPYGDYKIKINSVNTENDTYDKLTLTAARDYVRAGEPLELSAAATMNGAAVELGEGDVIWSVYNAANLRKTGNREISIKNGVLSVSENVVPQNIVVRAENASGSVNASYAVYVRPAKMNMSGENVYTDTFTASNACEEFLSGAELVDGSWDGSGYYMISKTTDFDGFGANTSDDVIYSADMKLTAEGAGWTIFSRDNGKQGMQITNTGGKFAIVKDSKNSEKYFDVDANAWYNVQIMCSTGGDHAYGNLIVYKYDANGNKVNPKTGTVGEPFVQIGVPMRNLAVSPASHIAINAGTGVDNVLCMYIAPDAFAIDMDASIVLAGATSKADVTATRKGVAFPYLNPELIKFEVYDENDMYPLEDEMITIDANGVLNVASMAKEQNVYVRVIAVKGDIYSSAMITVKPSDIFDILGIGISEDLSAIAELDINKVFAYDKEVTFVFVTYDADGFIKSTGLKSMYASDIPDGESTVTVNCPIKGFDPETDSIKVFTWTKLN